MILYIYLIYKVKMRMSMYHGVFSGPYFFVFSPNTGKYGPEKTTYLDTFHTVYLIIGN